MEAMSPYDCEVVVGGSECRQVQAESLDQKVLEMVVAAMDLVRGRKLLPDYMWRKVAGEARHAEVNRISTWIWN